MRKLSIVLLVCLLDFSGVAFAEPVESFSAFVSRFEGEAVGAGVPRETYRAATKGIKPVNNIPGLVTSQPEFTTPIWEYIGQRISSGRVGRGRDAIQRNASLFERVGMQTGVDPYIIAAIWGMESDYGSVLASSRYIRPIIPNLVTLAWHRRDRVKEDEAELIAALTLLSRAGWTPENLVGSWAGAIGHTQVIASGLLKYGADGDGDGRINPHQSLPDAVYTTANYLKALGYQPGQDWGFEVELPQGFDLSLATRTQLRPISFFKERGVKRVGGREFSGPDIDVFLYLPAGKNGPKFLMTKNYLVLKGYNFSDSYALSVAHLTDRLKGGGDFVSSWPTNTRFPNREQRVEIQALLKKLGFYQGEVDGRIGPITQEAYQKFQTANGLEADGFVTLESLAVLQKAAR